MSIRSSAVSLPVCLCLAVTLVGNHEAPVPASATDFTFTDITASAGLEKVLHGSFNHAVAWGDFDGDGRLDLFLGTFADRNATPYGLPRAPGNRLLRQTAGGAFEPFPCPVVENHGRCSGAVFADLDNDGDLDLYVTNNRLEKLTREEEPKRTAQLQGCKLYRNDGGGSFVEVSEASGACPLTLYHCRDAGVLDYDLDGLLDLLVTQDTVVRLDGKVLGCRLFRNRGQLRFEDVTTAAGLPGDLWSFGLAVADLNGDRRADFYLCGSNRLYLSQGKDRYQEAETQRTVFDHQGKELDSITGAALGDLDRDGDLDLITGPHHYHGPSRVHGFLNEGLRAGVPQFREVTKELGIPALPQKSPHPEIQDFDNDGILDLYWSVFFAEGTTRRPFICKGLGVKAGRPCFAVPAIPQFDEQVLRTNVPPAAGVGMVYYVDGPAIDYDGDGDMDFFCGNWPPEKNRLYRNDTKGGNWLLVRVEGRKMNRMGVGAQVRLYAAGKAANTSELLGYQEVTLNGGYSSGRPAQVHFGLGTAATCDLEVTFPTRAKPVVLPHVKVNRLLTIREP
jgi:hypothetical protein